MTQEDKDLIRKLKAEKEVFKIEADKYQKKVHVTNRKAHEIQSKIDDILEKEVVKYLKENPTEACNYHSDDTEEEKLLSLSNVYLDSGWECKGSPTGHCIQDETDSEYTCIICGNPDERK